MHMPEKESEQKQYRSVLSAREPSRGREDKMQIAGGDDNEKDMEKTYFNNDIDTFIYTFLEYGTQDEFLDIMYFLDLYTCIPVDERDRSYIINLICDIVKRSGRKDSIDKCKKLDEENETLFKKLVKKIN